METKRCTACGVEKPLNQFYKKSKNSKDGLQPRCKDCSLQGAKEHKRKKRGEAHDHCAPQEEIAALRSTIESLRKELKAARKAKSNAAEIKQFVYGLKRLRPHPPDWVDCKHENELQGMVGVPHVQLSDWHWAEFVDPAQTMGINGYTVETAARRVYRLLGAVEQIFIRQRPDLQCPGIILDWLGDMVSGAIHEELQITNEEEIFAALQSLLGVSLDFVKRLADLFGQVFCACVPGNHGRISKKMRYKGFAYENLDWHLYCLLQMHLENDRAYRDKVKFLISDSEQLQYRTYGFVHHLEHGHRFRGGSGVIGPYYPMIRGAMKRKNAMQQAGRPFDILLMGHFHTSFMIESLIANGSLIGMNEMAHASAFDHQPPRQNAWLTHPEMGVTYPHRLRLDGPKQRRGQEEWISWRAEAQKGQALSDLSCDVLPSC